MKQNTKEMLMGLWLTVCLVLGIVANIAMKDVFDSNVVLGMILTYGGTLAWFVFLYTFAYIGTTVSSGVIWGTKIKTAPALSRKKMIYTLLFLVTSVWSVTQVIMAIRLIFSGKIVLALILIVLNVVFGIIGVKLAGKLSVKDVARQTNALFFGEVDLFKEIDANMDEATRFLVTFEGVALFNKTNYCFAVYRYEDYQLGELVLPEEVAMVGMYFLQKYRDQFKLKLDVEVIPGEPGKTAVAFGTGGIAVAHTKGTTSQRNFRSYIFTRIQGR